MIWNIFMTQIWYDKWDNTYFGIKTRLVIWEFEPKICEICLRVHKQGGSICNRKACADRWIKLYMSVESINASSKLNK